MWGGRQNERVVGHSGARTAGGCSMGERGVLESLVWPTHIHINNPYVLRLCEGKKAVVVALT